MTGVSKFDELRMKTDRQVIQLVKNTLDAGVRNARQALLCAEDWALARDLYHKAKNAHWQAARLLPLAVDFRQEEHRELASGLERLGGMLAALSMISADGAPTEEKVSSLAHALWEARDCPDGLPEADWFRAERVLKQRAQSVYAGR